MDRLPCSFELDTLSPVLGAFSSKSERTLSDLAGQFLDAAAYERALAEGDRLVYVVYQSTGSGQAGDLDYGLTVLWPGKIGNEYWMTKGHYHHVLETSEVYYCLQGTGYMVMEDISGHWAVEKLASARGLYVAPGWAHRMVNVGNVPLAALYVCPSHAGHDYHTIETRGFRKLIVEQGGAPAIIDNPRWQGCRR